VINDGLRVVAKRGIEHDVSEGKYAVGVDEHKDCDGGTLIDVAPKLRIETPEDSEHRQCREHCRGDQGRIALEIKIDARAQGERKRRRQEDCGEREWIAAAAPRFEAERASRTHVDGETPEGKQNAEQQGRRIEMGREKDCPQTDGESGDVAGRDDALQSCPAIARDVRGRSVCVNGGKIAGNR